MKVGYIRKAIAGLGDDADLRLHMVSCPYDELNVVLESVAPSQDKTRLDVHVSVVHDNQLDEDDE